MADILNIALPGLNNYTMQEALKVIRTNIEFCGRDIKVIALTSFGENEGKTTVSAHLARSFSQLGKKALLIDADMRKSVFSGRNTDSTSNVGLSEVLSGIKSFDECVRETNNPGFYVLQSGKYPPNPVELLSSEYFSELIHYARENYDIVIIDTPPIGYTIDSAVISVECDGIVLVVGNQNLRRRQAKEMVDQISKSNVRILGFIRNFISGQNKRYYNYYYKKSNRYTYGYGSGGYGYGYGYGHKNTQKNGLSATKTNKK